MKKIILALTFLIVHFVFVIENCNSQVWSPMGSGMNNSVRDLIVYNGELIAGGEFTTAGGVSANRIAKWNGTSWLPLGSGMDSAIMTLFVFNGELIAGGKFTIAGGVSANRIAKWNGTSWSPLGSGLNEQVQTLAIYNNELVVGGFFTTAGGDSAKRIAKWNGINWSALGSGIGGVLPYGNRPYVGALISFNNELIVGGMFRTAGGISGYSLAKWNGTNWSMFSGTSDNINCFTIYNNELIAGATLIPPQNFYIARYVGNGWIPLGSNFSGPPFELIVYNNELIAGGWITAAGGDSVHNIAKWNGTNWSPMSNGVSDYTFALTVYNNDLIVGGQFTIAGNQTCNRIAKWGVGFSVSGNVRYADNNQPATGGYVKAIKLDKLTGGIITFDSAQIQANGNYSLTNVPQDSVDIGVYPNSTTQNDWVMTYYPSTIYWQNATTIYPTGNLTNINVGVYRLSSATNNNSVNGKVMRLNDSPSLANLKDAVLYAKSGNTFVRCGISDANGVYHLPSLPAGSLKIIVDRMGFRRDSTNVTVTLTSNLDSVNFALYGIYVGIRKTGEEIPSDCRLFQNYPNPFNPISTIKYQINEAKFVTLRVFDILGKEIAVLVNTKQTAGIYEATFDGSALPSGVYFYKLEAGDFTEVKKMVFVK